MIKGYQISEHVFRRMKQRFRISRGPAKKLIRKAMIGGKVVRSWGHKTPIKKFFNEIKYGNIYFVVKNFVVITVYDKKGKI